MKHKHIKHTNRNQIILAFIGVWFAAAMALFGWFAWQNTIYRQQFGEYLASLKQELNVTAKTFETLYASGDTAAIGGTLTDTANTLLAKIKQFPQAPGIAGLTLGNEANSRKQLQIIQYVQTYATNLQKAAAYVAYQQQIALPLQQLTLASSSNQQQLEELAAKWRAFGETMASITPPAQAEAVHAQFRQKIDTVIGVFTQLPERYKKIDIAGFSAKQKELNATIESLRPLGKEFAAIARTLDYELTESMAALKNIL